MKKIAIVSAILLIGAMIQAKHKNIEREYSIMYTVQNEGAIIYNSRLVRLSVPVQGKEICYTAFGKVMGKDIMRAFEDQIVQKHLQNNDIKPGQYRVRYKLNNFGRDLTENEGLATGFMADLHPIIIMT